MGAVSWKSAPDEHDYPAAASYLSLLAADIDLNDLIRRLKAADISYFKAKDMLRASRLALLPVDNPHVASDLRKITKGESLSPVLLVRGDLALGLALQIADGYHRVCASYYTDENTGIPCRMVGPADPGRPPRWSTDRPADRSPEECR
jgi:hypothetical protein